MRRTIASCVLAGTFVLGSGAAMGQDSPSEGLSKWLRNPFAKEAQPASSGRRGGGAQRSVPSAPPSAAPATAPVPNGTAGKPPGLARRLPGPRAAKMTLADDEPESDPIVPTSAEMPRRRLFPQVRVDDPTRNPVPSSAPTAVTLPQANSDFARERLPRQDVEISSEPVGEGVDTAASESTDPPVAQRTASANRPHLMQRRPVLSVRDSGRQTPTTARRKVSAKDGETAPGFSVDTGELEEVQVIGDPQDAKPSPEETPAETPANGVDGTEPRKERTTTASSERPSMSQRWKSWWGAKK